LSLKLGGNASPPLVLAGRSDEFHSVIEVIDIPTKYFLGRDSIEFRNHEVEIGVLGE
jgi:hypothetical protein